MSSRASALRRSSTVILLSSAMRWTVRSTVRSSTLRPFSLAYWSIARLVMRRSSTCLSSTSAGGCATFCCLSCWSTRRFASSSSYCVMASSFTTATTRSIACARGGAVGLGACANAPLAANATSISTSLRKIICSKLRKEVGRRAAYRLHGRVVRSRIARDAAPEDVDRIGTDARQAVEFELDVYRVADLLGVGNQPLRGDAEHPAPGIVLDPDHALQRRRVDQRIVPAADHRPVVAQLPLSRQVNLLQLRGLSGGVQ